ncbi:hypothetical protein Tco_1098227, partial [Tanacetum coccineum]
DILKMEMEMEIRSTSDIKAYEIVARRSATPKQDIIVRGTFKLRVLWCQLVVFEAATSGNVGNITFLKLQRCVRSHVINEDSRSLDTVGPPITSVLETEDVGSKGFRGWNGECQKSGFTQQLRAYYLSTRASPFGSTLFAILANYLGDDLLTVYRYFWSLGTEVIRMKTLKEDQRQLKGLPRVRRPTAAARNRRRPSLFQTTDRKGHVKVQGLEFPRLFYSQATKNCYTSGTNLKIIVFHRFDPAQLDCTAESVAHGHEEYGHAPNVNPEGLLNFAGISLLASRDDYNYRFVTWADLNISV